VFLYNNRAIKLQSAKCTRCTLALGSGNFCTAMQYNVLSHTDTTGQVVLCRVVSCRAKWNVGLSMGAVGWAPMHLAPPLIGLNAC